jgi:uncharacterized membrane protein YphA (DoxX/SURF4 family)
MLGRASAGVAAYLQREGPATQAAILRIALVALLWDRWASDFLLYKADTAFHWAVYGSFMVATPLLFCGLFTRVAAWWTAATMLAVFYGLGVGEGVESYTHHHTWLLTMFAVLMPLIPSGRALSVDRWLAMRRARRLGAPEPSDHGPTWAMPLLGLQLSAMYSWAAFDKCTWAFASGQRLHHIFQWYYGSADPIALPGFQWMMTGMAPPAAKNRFPFVTQSIVPSAYFFILAPNRPARYLVNSTPNSCSVEMRT